MEVTKTKECSGNDYNLSQPLCYYCKENGKFVFRIKIVFSSIGTYIWKPRFSKNSKRIEFWNQYPRIRE